MTLKIILEAYKQTATIVFNTIVVFVILNMCLFILITIRDGESRTSVVEDQYGLSVLQKVYPNYSSKEISHLLKELWGQTLVYEEFTQFRHKAHTGKYLNINTHGFRHVANQGDWPPNRENTNVFVFGGSTTYGAGVSDKETIASYLQQKMNDDSEKQVKVYNFGRSFYYSTQERILFQKLLVNGYVPDLAIFIDGLNDFYHQFEEPYFTQRLQDLTEENKLRDFLALCDSLPAVRFMKWLQRKVEDFSARPMMVSEAKKLSKTSNFVIDRYVANKKIISSTAKAFGVSSYFVWQPVPTYNYDDSFHLFKDTDYKEHKNTVTGYPAMRAVYDRDEMGDDFIWCADIQENAQKALYVDLIHYTANFSKEISGCILNALRDHRVASMPD